VRLHHVALGARDVERVAAFYRDLLGLAETARHRGPDGTLRSVWLDLGGATLMVERTAEPPRRVEGVGAGPFLLAIRASRVEVEGLVRALAERGFPIESRTPGTVYFRDPEGSRVALSAYPDRIEE
jgi:catechol 2,3-dioxygenase-like lactoylglutathione lyase family enzyme